MPDELLERGLAQAVDLHRITADKQGKTLDLFGAAVLVLADKRPCAVFVHYGSRTAARRTRVRDRKVAAPRKIVGYLGDYHVGLVDRYRIPYPELKRAYHAQIVHACT